MKILYVNTYYTPENYGGTETFVNQLAEGFVLRGHEVAVLCLSTNSRKRRIDRINGVIVFRESGIWYKRKHSLISKVRSIYNFKSYSTSKWVYNRFHPDIIHFNNEFGLSKSIWSSFSRFKIPMLMTMHDSHCYDDCKKNRYIPGYYNWYRKIANNQFKYIVTASEFMKFQIIESGFSDGKNIKVIYNGTNIDSNLFKTIIKSKLQRPMDIINFLYVGRIEEYKGIKIVLSAFHKINERNIRLHICGTGSLKKEVEDATLKDDRIFYYGQVARNNISSFYMMADVLIVPSIWEEPFGLTVIEGASYGCAIICSGRGGTKEILNALSIKDTYQAESDTQLKQLMIKYSKKNNIVAQVNSYINNIETFSTNKQIEEYYKLYLELI